MRYIYVMRKELDGTSDLFYSYLCSIYCVISAVIWRTDNVPSIDTMRCPRSSLLRVLVDDDFGTGRCQRSFVIIERAVELRFGGEARADVRLAQEVECCCCLFDQSPPEVHREGGVTTA